MPRRTVVLLAAMVALLGAMVLATVPALPVSASLPHAIDPTQIDPTLLKLPASTLPPGTSIDHSAISDNDDANGTTKSADGFNTQLRILHATSYTDLGRLTGYRMDFNFTLSGSPAGSEYLASVFPSAAKAQAAMADAISPGTLITIIGQPLAHQCSVGDMCKAYAGPVPGSTNKAVLTIFTDGPILVEFATQVPAAQFDVLEPAIESTLFALLAATDVQVKIALGETPATKATATATDTTVPPTATATALPPTATPTPKPKKCKKGYTTVKGKCKKKPVKCKKGYKLVHGKCKKH